MSKLRKRISIGLTALALAASSPAYAQFGGFGGMGGMGMMGPMGMGGFGGMGGMGGMGMGGMGMGGMGMAGMAISALAAAAQQNQYGGGYGNGYGYRRARYRSYQQPVYNAYPQEQYYQQGYAEPQAQYSVTAQKPSRARKGRRCYQQEWDAAEGYVNVAVPCR
jgi:hypothetical protein